MRKDCSTCELTLKAYVLALAIFIGMENQLPMIPSAVMIGAQVLNTLRIKQLLPLVFCERPTTAVTFLSRFFSSC